MKSTVAGMVVAGATALSLVLVGCGGQPATETQTKQETVQQTTKKTDAAGESEDSAKETGTNATGESSSTNSDTTSTTDTTASSDPSTSTDATTGDDQSTDLADNATADDGTASGNSAGSQSTASTIGEDEAKRIALGAAGVNEADVTGLYARLDTDDVVAKYEVEFQVGATEYEYDIDAETGAVIEQSSEVAD